MISVNYRDSRPIYEQIKTRFQQMIISGAIPADTKLPSVRELASQLAINPNTIQKAYRELESDGFIVSVPGKGSFAGDASLLKKKHLALLLCEFENLSVHLFSLGATEEELTARIITIGKGVSAQ